MYLDLSKLHCKLRGEEEEEEEEEEEAACNSILIINHKSPSS